MYVTLTISSKRDSLRGAPSACCRALLIAAVSACMYGRDDHEITGDDGFGVDDGRWWL